MFLNENHEILFNYNIFAFTKQSHHSIFSAPWPADIPKCSTECPIAGSPKLNYAPEKTYVYSHSGKSRIHMNDVEGGISEMEWTSQVELTWLSPCDMAISIKNPSIGGGSGKYALQLVLQIISMYLLIS